MKEETTTQWPQPELLHYKFGLEASRVHVVPNLPASTSRLPEGKQSNRVQALAKSGMSLGCL